ncbi:AAA family ATPase [Heliobacillus mobilis]|uniref:Nuclease SbcCD subunit C n=1 Tax=Heliobacterium mobile TaxID=28064 RepID=A0A6I3SDG9_HELMO|nr:AAA family ATPase [Heliobacterium mobile]MTV47735.1 AAA family ATPase [Heliobacterium mobile]
MITEVRYRNFKGQTGAQPLTGMDLFMGPNGAGKTTRLQALGLSTLGYVPGNGKTTQDTFKLATGEEMSVGLRVGSFSFERTFERKSKSDKRSGKTTVTIAETVSVSPGQGEKNDTQKKARIAAEIGQFPVMLDFGAFLELSDAKRRDFIYGLSPITSDSWNRDRIYQFLTVRLLTGELEKNNPEQYQEWRNLISEVFKQFPEDYDIHAGLQGMIDWTSAQLSIWNGKQKDAQGAVRQLADMKNELAETDRNIIATREELEKLREQLLQLERQIAMDNEKRKINENRLSRIEKLRTEIDDLKKGPTVADTTDLERRIAELKAQMAPSTDIEEELAPLRQLVAKLREERETFVAQKDGLTGQKAGFQAQITVMETALKQTSELNGRCIIAPNLISCTKSFSGFDTFIENKKQETQAVLTDVDSQIAAVTAKINTIDENIQRAQQRMDATTRGEQEKAAASRKIAEEIQKLNEQKNERVLGIRRLGDLIEMKQNELTRLLNERPEAIGDVDLMKVQTDGIRTRIEELEKTLAEKDRAKQTLLLLQQSMLENRTAEYKAAGLKYISEALGPKGIQGELVKEVIDPIRKDVQTHLHYMGFEYEPFFETKSETGKEVFQFGWVGNKGQRVNFDALSTGQQTVFLAALMVTILERANPKLKVLAIDNVNHLDRKNLEMAVRGLAKLRGKVDNIILAGAIEFVASHDELEQVPEEIAKRFVLREDIESMGWRVWNLGATVEKAEVA